MITSATSYVGFYVLIQALEAGYAIQCVVRSQSKANELLAHPIIKQLAAPYSLYFAIVPDFTVGRAFDLCTRGLSHIIYVASLIPGPTKTV